MGFGTCCCLGTGPAGQALLPSHPTPLLSGLQGPQSSPRSLDSTRSEGDGLGQCIEGTGPGVEQVLCEPSHLQAFPSIHSSPQLAGLTVTVPRDPSTQPSTCTLHPHLALCALSAVPPPPLCKAGLVRGLVTDSCVTVSSSM